MTFVSIDPYRRFAEKYRIDQNGCHIWTSTVKKDGYGQFWLSGKPVKAHQAAYLLFIGPIPSGQCVLHRCDVRTCVNPAHLYAGTHKQNTRDMFSRGRAVGKRKVTDEQVAAILADLEAGHPQQIIAARFGVHQTTISQIKRRRVWYVAGLQEKES